VNRRTNAGLCNRRRHLGVDFEVWSQGRSWFWFLVDPRGNAGMIGAAAKEAQAVREACASIEAILAVPSVETRPAKTRPAGSRKMLLGFLFSVELQLA